MNLDFINRLSLKDRYKLYLLIVNDHEKAIQSLKSIGYNVINIGEALSLKLRNNKSQKHLNFFIQEYLESLIRDNTNNVDNDKKLVFLSNLGILLEPDIAFNPERTIAEISKNTHIVLLWSGIYDQQSILKWKTQEKNFILDFSQYGLHPINLKNEI